MQLQRIMDLTRPLNTCGMYIHAQQMLVHHIFDLSIGLVSTPGPQRAGIVWGLDKV